MIAPMSEATELKGLCEATARIYAVDVKTGADRWIDPPLRFNVIGTSGPWPPYPDTQLYFDVLIGNDNLKVLDKEIAGKAKVVPLS